MKIEVCNNNEWWRVFGPCSEVEGNHDAEVILNDMQNRIVRALEDAGNEADFPRGQRTICSQWNGARFTRKSNGIGTFDTVSDAEWNKVCAIVDFIVETTMSVVASEIAMDCCEE